MADAFEKQAGKKMKKQQVVCNVLAKLLEIVDYYFLHQYICFEHMSVS